MSTYYNIGNLETRVIGKAWPRIWVGRNNSRFNRRLFIWGRIISYLTIWLIPGMAVVIAILAAIFTQGAEFVLVLIMAWAAGGFWVVLGTYVALLGLAIPTIEEFADDVHLTDEQEEWIIAFHLWCEDRKIYKQKMLAIVQAQKKERKDQHWLERHS